MKNKEQYNWDLTKIFKSKDEYEAEISKVDVSIIEIVKYKNSVMSSSQNLLDVIQKSEEVSRIISKIVQYVHLNMDLDTRNSYFQEEMSKLRSLFARIGSELSFIEPEIIEKSELVDKYINENSSLLHYKHKLDNIVRQKEHILTQKEESILASCSELFSAPQNSFMLLNNADLKFNSVIDSNGEEHKMSIGKYSQLLENKDRKLRENAFKEMYKVYQNHINVISSTLESNVKANVINSKIRGYESARHAALFDNKIPIEVYDNLIEAVHEALPTMYKYLQIRKEVLDVEELHFYDLYTPLVKDLNLNINYEEAKAKVLKALEPMGEDYLDIVKRAFNERWIDVYEKPGKRSGAYSSGSYDTPPYMLLNHKDNVNSMFTLIHEMGHSMHSYYSIQNQEYTYSNYSIFLAEIASTFNESLLSRYLIDNSKNREEKLYIVNYFLEMFKGTVFRQTMFAEFEKKIYDIVEGGGALSPDLLNNLYLELNKLYFGDNVYFDDEIKYEWSRIPHFYYNFYVYQYATGLCAATTFSSRVLNKEAGALENYMSFLKAGSSKYPVDVLKDAGLNIVDKNVIKEGLNLFKTLVDKFEKMLENEYDN